MVSRDVGRGSSSLGESGILGLEILGGSSAGFGRISAPLTGWTATTSKSSRSTTNTVTDGLYLYLNPVSLGMTVWTESTADAPSRTMMHPAFSSSMKMTLLPVQARLFPTAHLSPGKVLESPDENLVLHPLVVRQVKDLRQPYMPRRVPRERHMRPEEDQ